MKLNVGIMHAQPHGQFVFTARCRVQSVVKAIIDIHRPIAMTISMVKARQIKSPADSL